MSSTAVFGMGTGGPSPQSTPTILIIAQATTKINIKFLYIPGLQTSAAFEVRKGKSSGGNELARSRGSERSAACF